MKNDITTFASLTIEARTEVIKECIESSSLSIKRTEDEMSRLIELFRQQKDAVGHGKWISWIRETFADDDAQVKRIQRYMRGPNSSLVNYLDIGDTGDGAPSRSALKTGQVEVVKPGQQDDDPAPTPPTQRKTAAGSRQKPESEKPRTQTIVPELLPDPPVPMSIDPVSEWIGATSLTDIVSRWVDVSVDPKDEKRKKEVANRLRKLADKLDPPTKFVPPTVEEVSEYCREKGYGIDAEDFVSNGEAYGWVDKNKRKYKDWMAVVRTWVAFEKKHNGHGKSGSNAKQQSHADRIKAIVAATFG